MADTASGHTNICPGNCGEAQDFGKCDSDSGTCTCNLGWTGPDCSEPTCCPLYAFVGGGAALVLLMFACLSWRFYFGKSEWKPRKKNKPAAKTSDIESVPSDSSERPQHCAEPQQGSTDLPTFPAEKLRSSVHHEGLRTSAWGEQPSRSPSLHADASGTTLRRSKSDASSQRGPPLASTSSGSSFANSRSGTSTSENDASESSARSPSRAHTANRPAGVSTSDSSLSLSESDRTLSPQVRAVNQKMRDMMDEPFLVRKKTFKELLVENHPDKNSEDHAKEVFQAVNNARGWFLHEPQLQSS